jgi:hypothetical protein
MIYNVGNPIIKLPFGDGFCSTHKKSDVGMVYEWVYQIIYDDHNPWEKTPKQPVFEGTTVTTEGFAMANLWDFIEISLDNLQKSDTIEL